jgi:predicted SnoaL-like aldol condensation-catalyzing enzyme
MKKLFLFSMAAVFMLASCKDKDAGGMSDRAKKNLDAMHVVNKAFETGDASGIDAVVADNFVDHTPKGDWNRDSLKSMIPMMKKSMPDTKMTTIQEFANDDYVVGWYTWTGTSDGSMGGPKGPYTMQAIEVAKVNADGKATEHWEFMQIKDAMDMMKSMGGGNAGGGDMMPKDTTKMK